MTRLEKMALGRRKSYLLRCIQAQDLLEKHETPCTVRVRIFEMHIKPVMKCSYATFNNMLNESNPRLELESVINKMSEI